MNVELSGCDCCREKLHEAHSDLQKKREVIDDLEPRADSNSEDRLVLSLDSAPFFKSSLLTSRVPPPAVAKKIDELQETLRKKDEDMKRMEERYKHYVEKARTVRRTS